MTFLGMVDRMQQNESIAVFLRPAFYGDYCDYGYDVLMESMIERETFAELLLRPTVDTGYRHHLARGLEEFLSFCGDFDELLQDSDGHPLLQSAMWNYYADIFQTKGTNLTQSISTLISTLDDGSEGFREVDKNIRVLFERLTSGSYGRYISESVVGIPTVER